MRRCMSATRFASGTAAMRRPLRAACRRLRRGLHASQGSDSLSAVARATPEAAIGERSADERARDPRHNILFVGHAKTEFQQAPVAGRVAPVDAPSAKRALVVISGIALLIAIVASDAVHAVVDS